MFIVLKENEGGLTTGVNGGVSSLGTPTHYSINNQVGNYGQGGQGSYGVAYQTAPHVSGFGTAVHLNNGFSQTNPGMVYGNALASDVIHAGNGAFSVGSNLAPLGTNVVGSVPHAIAGFLPTNTQRREIHVVNTLTGQIVPAIQEITPIGTCASLNTWGVNANATTGQQTTWGNEISSQKTLMFNLIDNDQFYCIECFSPEFDAKNSEVTLTPNGLRIRVSTGKNVNGDGGFYTIPTPFDVDSDKITAHSSKGYLKISLPRSKKALESFKKIKID